LSTQDQTRPYLADGLSLALLVVLVTAAERFDRGRAEVAVYGDQVQRGWLPCGWLIAAVLGAVVAVWVGLRFVEEAKKLKGERVSALPWLLLAALAAWLAWQVTGALVVWGWDIPEGVRAPLHGAAAVFALAAVCWAGGVVPGDATGGWKLASVVRLQLILLTTLLAAVLVLPITSDQCLDVLRAWGDGPYTRAAVGLAAGVLLGAVCRASAFRLLVPEGAIASYHVKRSADAVIKRLRRVARVRDTETRRHITVLPWAIPLAIAVAGLALVGWEPAAIALGSLILMAVVTKWADPPMRDAEKRASLKRLAGTLGVVPLGIVLAGLSSAAVDSLLLPSPLTGTDAVLIVYSLAAFAGFWLLCADAHVEHDAWLDGHRRRHVVVGLVAAAGFAGALAPGSVLDLGDAADVATASLLLVVAAFVAARRWLPSGGAPELWVGGAVVLGAGVAVYAEPIAAARTLGAFGLVFIGATGVLLVLHLAGAVGSRRAFRASFDGLPERAPVVALLGVWVVAAFLLAPETVHQVRTVPARAEAKPERLGEVVRDWLDAQATHPVRPAQGEPYVPMLLVAASGGGAKAAYWTDLVADCMFGAGDPAEPDSVHECRPRKDTPERYGRLFLTSSVSGGSVGVRHLVANSGAMTRGEEWVERAAAREALSPVVGWGIFHDLPAFMLGAELDPRTCEPGAGWACRRHADRALVQEAAVADLGLEAALGGGLLGRDGPVTVFNAAENGAARRILLARVGLAPLPSRSGCTSPPTRDPIHTGVDAHDVLGPGVDVPVRAAAIVSARFPVVAPAARIGSEEAPETPNCERRTHLSPVVARDGGYVENSGLLTIAELLPRLQRVIASWRKREGHAVDVRPVVVSIDDDPESLAAELNERSGGAFGIGRTAGPGFLTASARAAIDNCAFAGVSYFRISPPRRVGAKAATGWETSETTRYEDLGDGIAKGLGARRALNEIRDILAGEASPAGCDWTFPG
jgi:hypothetical protein